MQITDAKTRLDGFTLVERSSGAVRIDPVTAQPVRFYSMQEARREAQRLDTLARIATWAARYDPKPLREIYDFAA